jgi:DNA polymerase elongation subunit (family B)
MSNNKMFVGAKIIARPGAYEHVVKVAFISLYGEIAQTYFKERWNPRDSEQLARIIPKAVEIVSCVISTLKKADYNIVYVDVDEIYAIAKEDTAERILIKRDMRHAVAHVSSMLEASHMSFTTTYIRALAVFRPKRIMYITGHGVISDRGLRH